MRKAYIAGMILFFLISFSVQMLALIRLIPLYISSPILFLSILVFFSYLNNRNKFKGFQ
ncbi:hypothetical protein JOC94_004385 [Bacillus thermophilus]|uniref:Uncharacterized protein n=1 Tax=Siminovitchia thermophila TaxID=1245522 RepID=A0ABS2RER6_9BACI|nr:hypothetical protein [Siminovitchia thermophila]